MIPAPHDRGRFTIITPLAWPLGLAESARLHETARTIAAQNTAVTWRICADGDVGQETLPHLAWELRNALPAGSHVTVGATSRTLTAATTRNIMLADVATDWVIPVDAGDMLPDETLTALRDAITANPTAQWVFGRSATLGPSAALPLPQPSLPSVGMQTPGVWTGHAAEQGEFPWQTNGGCYRTSMLRSLGGWPAVTAESTRALMLVAADTRPGALLDRVLYVRRDADVSVVDDARWRHGFLRTARRIAIDRVDPERTLNWNAWLTTGTATTDDPTKIDDNIEVVIQ